MDDKNMLAMGRILGEIYRLQKEINPEMCTASESDIYALLNGVQSRIDYHLTGELSGIHPEYVTAIYDGLDTGKGYYGIVDAIEDAGYKHDTMKILTVLRYTLLDDRYTDTIEKVLNSDQRIPAELKNLMSDLPQRI
jgi:hypothetical protein